MNDETLESFGLWSSDLETFLIALDRFSWFAHVGDRVSAADAKQVFSWDIAWECTQDDSWINASFHKDVDQSHPVWRQAYDRALQSVSESGRNHELQEGIHVGLQAAWDSGGAAYQIVTGAKDGFYIRLMDWYRRGHWPCGWEGKYPLGRLIVF